MAVQGLQAQLRKAEQDLDLAEDNYRITSEKVMKDNDELRRLQNEEREKLDRINKPLQSKQAEFTKARATYDLARKKFDDAQAEWQKAQDLYSRLEKTFNESQASVNREAGNVSNVINLALKRLERDIALNQREADSWRIKAVNARRDVAYFREKLHAAEEQERRNTNNVDRRSRPIAGLHSIR